MPNPYQPSTSLESPSDGRRHPRLSRSPFLIVSFCVIAVWAIGLAVVGYLGDFSVVGSQAQLTFLSEDGFPESTSMPDPEITTHLVSTHLGTLIAMISMLVAITLAIANGIVLLWRR